MRYQALERNAYNTVFQGFGEVFNTTATKGIQGEFCR